MVLYGLVCCDLVWSCMVWSAMVWYNMVLLCLPGVKIHEMMETCELSSHMDGQMLGQQGPHC